MGQFDNVQSWVSLLLFSLGSMFIDRRDNTRITNKPPPPVPVTLTKGSVHIVVTREFVNYILYNKDALAFRDWVKDTYIPDETFFSSLNHSPQLGVPGAYLGM